MTGYCLLVLGEMPAYRIIFKKSLQEALKTLPELREKSNGRVEVLKMINGDTLPLDHLDEDNYSFLNTQ